MNLLRKTGQQLLSNPFDLYWDGKKVKTKVYILWFRKETHLIQARKYPKIKFTIQIEITNHLIQIQLINHKTEKAWSGEGGGFPLLTFKT